MITSLDVETTTHNKGNPFDSRNRLVCYSCSTDNHSFARRVLDLSGWESELGEILSKSTLIVGFNFKFDYHWFRKQGIDLSKHRIWDCQLAEFVISKQTNSYPSLEETASKYGLGHKIDVVKEEYWKKGIQTDEIPWEVLEAYAIQDTNLTLKIYYEQLKVLTPAEVTLVTLMCQDLHILEEMEWNGTYYDEELCNKRSKELDDEIKAITEELRSIYPDVVLNFNSPDHLSAFLYGGTVVNEFREQIGVYKTGAKVGEPRYRVREVEHTLPRLFNPLPGSELKKPGLYSTDEATLKKLKGKKHVREQLLRLSRLEKLNGTYYKGLPTLNKEMHWPKSYLHGQFNQVVARTGRLSSKNPNLQNFASELQDIFVSRYPEDHQ